MKNTFFKLTMVICILAIIMGSTLAIFAAEVNITNEKDLPIPTITTMNKTESQFTQVSKNFPLSKGVDINEIKKGLQKSVNSKNKIDNTSIQTLVDTNEPNDTSASAKTINYNSYVYANIGTASDEDWYSIYLNASSDPGDTVAFLLKDIPAGCDYDLYVFDPNFNYAASQNSGNSNETLYIDITTTGKWYVVVVPYSGYNENSDYKLYVGDAWKSGSTGWIPLNKTFKYSSYNVGEALPYELFDLTNNTSIPNTAVVKQITIGTEFYTGNWGNQHKYIYSPQTGSWYQTFVGLDIVLNVPQYSLFVKQQWAITTMVETLFISPSTWTPDILISYYYLAE